MFCVALRKTQKQSPQIHSTERYYLCDGCPEIKDIKGVEGKSPLWRWQHCRVQHTPVSTCFCIYKNIWPTRSFAKTKRWNTRLLHSCWRSLRSSVSSEFEKLVKVCVNGVIHSILLTDICKKCYCVCIFTSWTTYVDEQELLTAILDSKLIIVTKKSTWQALWNKHTENVNNPLSLRECY